MDKKNPRFKIIHDTLRTRDREDNNLRGALVTHHIVQVQRKLGARGN